MNKRVRVNIRTAVNAAGIRRERRAGRDKIIVPSATLPDGVVMNGIRYLAEEIEGKPGAGTGYMTLNNTLAPLGHPTIEGAFVSASHPEGINAGWIGAHNENVRRENGRVFLDKVIDVARASESAGGKAVLAAIEKGEPVHTSTGLFCELEACTSDQPDGAKFIARNMTFDHDAILLGEEGAATPAQGVGMLVNGQQVEVINCTLAEDAERELNWAVESLARAVERKQKLSVLERMKAAIMEVLGAGNETKQQQKGADMADEKQMEALAATVQTVKDAQEKIGETIANAVAAAVKPLIDAQAAMVANAKAKDEAELADHVATIVKANLLDEEAAKELTLNAARKLAERAKPGKAAALNGAFNQAGAADEFAGYDLNKLMEAK